MNEKDVANILELEKMYFELIKTGQAADLEIFLREHESFDTNLRDTEGNTGLRIAVRNGNESVVKSILSQKNARSIDIGDCLLLSVQSKRTEILVLILDHLHSVNPLFEASGVTNSVEYTDDTTPLTLAARCGYYEVIRFLLDRGHRINHHSPKCTCSDCKERLMSNDSFYVATVKLRHYEAITNPAYICNTAHDPILTAFLLCKELQQCEQVDDIFGSNYHKIQHQTRVFASDLIGCCRSMQEVEMVLKNPEGLASVLGVEYPRLVLAMDLNQKEFVANPNVQLVLEKVWSGDWHAWRLYGTSEKILYGFLLTILRLPYSVFFMTFLPNSKTAAHFKLPLNRMLSSWAFQFIFLTLLLYISNQDKRTTNRGPPQSVVVYLIFLYMVSYFWNIVYQCLRQGVRRYFRIFWNVYGALTQLMLLMVFIFWWIAWLNVRCSDPHLERKYWHWMDPALIAESFFVVATVMAFSQLLFFCQLNYTLGPLQVALGKMTEDFVKFMAILIIILFAYLVGLLRLYEYYDGMMRIDPETKLETRQESSFTSPLNTFKTLFWSIFGMTSDTAPVVIIENLRDENGNADIINHHYFTQAVGYALFASFMVLMVIIVLNMLIATMSNTFQRVTDNVDMEWIFGRTQVYMAYMFQAALAPPFNLLPTTCGTFRLLHCVKNFLIGRCFYYVSCQCRKCLPPEPPRDSEFARKYSALMTEIVRRYLRHKIEPLCQRTKFEGLQSKFSSSKLKVGPS